MAHAGPQSTTDVTSDACGRSLTGMGVPVNARLPVSCRGEVPSTTVVNRILGGSAHLADWPGAPKRGEPTLDSAKAGIQCTINAPFAGAGKT